MDDYEWLPLSTATVNAIADRLAQRRHFRKADKPKAHPTHLGQWSRMQNYLVAMQRFREMGGTRDGRDELWLEISTASDLNVAAKERGGLRHGR